MRERDDEGNHRSSGVHQCDRGFGAGGREYKAVEVKRECDYIEDWAQQRLEAATAAAMKAAEESKRRAMEAQQAVVSQANVSRPPGLLEPKGE